MNELELFNDDYERTCREFRHGCKEFSIGELSKYLEMDKELLELNFEQEGDQVALMLSIPVIRAKDEEEIEKALAEAAEKKAETASTENEEEDNEETETPEDIEGEEKIESEDSDEIEAVEDSESSEEITESEIAENISSETEKSDYNDNSEIKSKKSSTVKVEKDLKEKTNV